MDSRAIGYKELSQFNPGLVWVALTPFGQSGPKRDWKGSDLIGWAQSGVLYTTGFPDSAPVLPGGPTSLAYSFASINAAIGGLLALRARAQTGRGQLVDVSQQESTIATGTENGLPTFLDDMVPRLRNGNRRQNMRPFGLYRCKDGYVIVIIVSAAHWSVFAEWIREVAGIEAAADPLFRDYLHRRQHSDLVDEWTEALTMRYTKQDIFEAALKRGLVITPVNTMSDLVEDAQLQATNYWAEVSHPVLGNVKMAGAPYRLSETPWQPGRPPMLGEHNEAIYSGELGMSEADLTALRRNGVI